MNAQWQFVHRVFCLYNFLADVLSSQSFHLTRAAQQGEWLHAMKTGSAHGLGG